MVASLAETWRYLMLSSSFTLMRNLRPRTAVICQRSNVGFLMPSIPPAYVSSSSQGLFYWSWSGRTHHSQQCHRWLQLSSDRRETSVSSSSWPCGMSYTSPYTTQRASSIATKKLDISRVSPAPKSIRVTTGTSQQSLQSCTRRWQVTLQCHQWRGVTNSGISVGNCHLHTVFVFVMECIWTGT